MSNGTSQWRSLLDLATSLALLGASCAVGWALLVARPSGAPSKEPPKPPGWDAGLGARIAVKDSPRLGSLAAPVGIIEFSDFQCTYCARFSAETLPALQEKFLSTGKAALFLKHFPLRMHPLAERSAVYAECLRPADKFWRLAEILFAKGTAVSTEFLDTEARNLGGPSVAGCLERGDATARVQADLTEALKLGLNSTPYFMFGVLDATGTVLVSKTLKGTAPVEGFAKAIESVSATK
jgi:protein-disulfide isomerase